MLRFTGEMQKVLLDKNHFIKYSFTIKSAGSGTGMGLSLSNDIIKAYVKNRWNQLKMRE